MLKADLAVYNESQERILSVEIKTIRRVADEWASQLRRNILAHGNYPHARYFLLATPDKFFLWADDNNSNGSSRKPDYTADSGTVLEPYFKEFDAQPENVSGFVFEQIVGRWLKGVMYPDYRDSDEAIPNWVRESGLDKAVFQGDFSFEKAA